VIRSYRFTVRVDRDDIIAFVSSLPTSVMPVTGDEWKRIEAVAG
jgi:hypothetical protein